MILDTNVLVYALGSEHPLRAPCRALMDALEDGELAATTTPMVIAEFAHVFARRRGRVAASAAAAGWTTLLEPLIEVAGSVTRDALRWFADKEIDAADAFLAAALDAMPDATLVSADQGFAFLGDRWLTPQQAARRA